MSKKTRLENSFDKLEKKKEKALNILKNMPEDQIKIRPAGDSWSAIQALRHIQLSEDASLRYMQKKILAGDDLPRVEGKARRNLFFLFVVFALNIKFKAPSVLADPEITSLASLEEDWNETRKKMKEYVDSFPEKWLSRGVNKHPRVGMLTLLDAIRFFNVHLNHHIRQVNRIRRQL